MKNVAVLIPTYNAGDGWTYTLEQIYKQRYPIQKVCIIDSESTDNTVAIARASGAGVISIAKNDFRHGSARRQLVKALPKTIDIYVFMTQDAVLASEDSIEELVRAFDDETVGLAYGRQLPKVNAHPLEAHHRMFNYPAETSIKGKEDIERYGFKTFFCSNSFAGYRKEAYVECGGFPPDAEMGEDALLVANMILKGWKAMYKAEATVFHSHHFNLKQEYKRYQEIGRFHQEYSGLLAFFGKPGGEGLKYVISEIRYCLRHQPLLIFLSFARCFNKLLGYKAGLRASNIQSLYGQSTINTPVKYPRVHIVMATYNGGLYIKEQLDSLLKQTYENWELLIRDDNSTDNTLDIIHQYQLHEPRIHLTVNTSPVKGACRNFAELFKLKKNDPDCDYLMFCDQDDIWLPDKLAATFLTMRRMETEYPGQPALVYGNFQPVDVNASTFNGLYKLKHSIKLQSLLSSNYVYGCTILINRAMIFEVDNIPNEAVNHDYWLALVASLNRSSFISKPMMYYRQHNNNASGNVSGNNSMLARLRRNLLAPERELNDLKKRLATFRLFLHRYQSQMSPKQQSMIEDYLNSFSTHRLNVCGAMLWHGIFRRGLLQTANSFFQVLAFYNQLKITKNTTVHVS